MGEQVFLYFSAQAIFFSRFLRVNILLMTFYTPSNLQIARPFDHLVKCNKFGDRLWAEVLISYNHYASQNNGKKYNGLSSFDHLSKVTLFVEKNFCYALSN